MNIHFVQKGICHLQDNPDKSVKDETLCRLKDVLQ